MKISILFLTISFFHSCSNKETDLSSLPLINSVSDMNQQRASAVPMSNDKLFVVTGKVVGTIFILGEGMIELQDINQKNQSLFYVSKSKPYKNDTVTVTLKKKEIASIDDDELKIYFEVE